MAFPLLLALSGLNDQSGDVPARRRSALRGASVRDVAAEQADRALVDRIRAGDPTALDELVRTYFTPLARFASQFTGSYDAAEDLAQGVFCRVWEHREQWTPTAGARAYLFAAVRNAAINLRKHEDVVSRHRARTAATTQNLVAPAEVDESVDEQRRVLAALESLTERQRTALRLRYEQGLAAREIAAVLDVTTRAVERLLARALILLRAALMGESY